MKPFIAFLFLVQLAAAQDTSNTFYVSKGGSGRKPYFTDLNDAVKAVSSSGTTIMISPGIYEVGQVTLSRKQSHLTLVGSGRGTVIRPKWDGRQPYSVKLFGYQTFSADSADGLEIGNFTYDGRGDSIIDTKSTDLKFGTFTACKDLYIHDIYAVNGGNIQDKSFVGLYNSEGSRFINNTVIDFDVAFMVTNHLSGRMIISGNTIVGGKSEGIIVWTDTHDTTPDAYHWSTNPRSVIISGNYVYDKNTYAINVKRSWNAAVTIIGNSMGRSNEYPGYSGGGIALDSCSNVSIVGNTYSGTFCFIVVNGYAKNVSIVANPVQYISGGSFLFHASTFPTRELENFTITSNPIAGAREAPAWSAVRAYVVGEVVSVGSGKAYLCKLRNTDKRPPDAGYWEALEHDYPAIWGWFKNSIISNNTIAGVRNAGIYLDRRPTNVRITDNAITGTMIGIQLKLNPDDTSGASTVDNLQIRGNTISTLDSTGNGYALLLDSYKLTNSIIADNYLTASFPMWGATQIVSRILENVTVENNTLGGNPGGVVYRDRGGAKKWNNTPLGRGTLTAPDTSLGGYVNVGETFWATNPTNIVAYMCATGGYGTKGQYTNEANYTLGDHVTGSDGAVYVCTQAHTGETDKRPTTGSKWKMYWRLLGPPAEYKAMK